MENKNGINFVKKFNIPSKIKSYKIEKELCQLSTSHLCLATNLNIKERVLIKIYDKETVQHNFDEISLINNDIFMMRLINHKNILKLYEIIESPSYIFLVMENFNPIKLSDYIKSKKKLSEDDSIKIFTQIINVLLYFNEMNIGHLNLNPDDILIDNSHNIKICDFKYSVFYSSNEQVKCKFIGDPNYLSPELISEKKCFPELADIWSSGVLLYLCLVGQLPFKGINNLDLQKKIMSAEFSLPLNISKSLQELIKNIFEAKTDLRYNLEKILNSSLFKEKKIKKNNLSKGFNVLSTKYPIDERVINICNTYFGIEPEEIKQKLFKNIFDPQTSLYKQIIAKFIRKKISTEIDLCSKKFNNYIENKKNILDDSTQKNNIQENLEKLEEIKTKKEEIQNKIEEKEKNILIHLDELIERYQNYLEDIKEKEKEENLEKNKNDELNNKVNKEYVKRNSVNIISKKNYNKFNTYENQLNYGKRRMSTNIHSSQRIKKSLEKLSNKENNLKKSSDKNVEKYIHNKTDIISEIKEEEEKKEPSPSSSKSSSRNLSLNKTQSKINDNNINKNDENLNNKNKSSNIEKKQIKINSDKNKSNKLQKENKNIKATKDPPPKVTKEEFFSQIKNVKLKKYTPNTYVNPDEIKKSKKEENKNQTAVEYTNVSVKNVLEMVEENLKNVKKNKNNLSVQKRKEKSSKIKKDKMNKNNNKNLNTNKSYKKRKSIKNKDLFMFQKKGMLINKTDIGKEKSKDDVSRFKYRTKKYNEEEVIQETDLEEFVIPKDYQTEKKIKEEKRKKYEEKRIKKGKEKKESEDKKKKELEKKKQKEIEEQKRKEEEELRLKLLEEERIRKEKEEEERRIKEKEGRQSST